MRALWAIGMSLLAGQALAGDGRLLGSGGLVSVDGAAGGGLLPWAVIAGHGERGQWDVVSSVAAVDTGDFDLRSAALALAWDNRLELSFARLSLGLDGLVRRGQFPDQRLDVDVFGAKWRLAGDLIYGTGPQWAAGLQWRRSRDPQLVRFASADEDTGVDAYLSASKLWIDGLAGRRTVVSLGLRSSTANQLGLAGFSTRRSALLEGSIGVFVAANWLVGAEYRNKPDRLAFASEDDWSDVFLAWLPNKHWQMSVAYVDLGSIGGLRSQRGFYLALQGAP